MSRTPEEQYQWERHCFGCALERLRPSVEGSISGKRGQFGMVAMSMLSDAQEQLERGSNEQARQTINRAKWVISEYLSKREES